MKQFLYIGGLVGLYVIGLLFLLLTNPQHLAISYLILPFVIFFIALFVSVRLVFSHFVMFDKKLSRRQKTSYAALIVGFPTILIVLQSIGQFSLRDLITITILFAVLWFYVVRLNTT